MTDIVVALNSPVPVYEQIRSQVAAAVAVGTLRPGDRLPASRDLARDLGIAVGTVQRAYKELEAGGVVESRRRTGTVIAPRAGTSPEDGGATSPPPSVVVAQARSLVMIARQAGLTDDALVDVVRGALAAR